MSTIFGLFFFIIIVVLLIGLSLVSSILRLLFGSGNKTGRTNNTNHNQMKDNPFYNEQTPQANNRKKIFDDDEGEYVDFEEVEDDK